jgi:hypothetical protein
MTPKKILIGLALFACLAGAAYLAREAEGSGPRLTEAASKFHGSLTADQKKRAVFDFDSKERTRWFFTPQQAGKKALRKGLPLEDMTAEQKKLALEIVRAGTSKAGFEKATAIMGLEDILKGLEKGKGPVRNREWYFVTLFGEPTKTGKWGCRIEGHHLSLNYTVDGNEVVSATPAVFAANPAVVKAGPKKGFRALPESLDPYDALLASLDDGQKKAARQGKLHPEIKEAEAKPTVGAPTGLAHGKMGEKQQSALMKLIEGYAGRLPDDVAAAELKRLKDAGVDKVYFAYAVEEKRPGKPHTYRIQGPTFLIEYINEQNDAAGNPANHIHSAWRNTAGDFGLTK